MRTLLGLFLVASLVVACGGGTDARGSIGWDAGVAVLEIRGAGAHVLQITNTSDVPLRIEGRNPENNDSMTNSPLTKGGTLRHEVSGPRIYRLMPRKAGEAHVTYVVTSDEDKTVRTHIEP